MTNKSAAAVAKTTEMTPEERHFLEVHTRVVIDKVNGRVTIGFAHSCGQENCPGTPPVVVFMRCPGGPCPP
jgi:hypothetical protein